MSHEEQITQAAELIDQSNYIVAFTGAGISVESGIPDFRSEGGLWTKYNPDEYATYSAFLTHPEKYWTMHKELRSLVLTAKPNPAHIALAVLENEQGKLKTVITQNVDFLHTRAGNTVVHELHGSTRIYHCVSCKAEYEYTEIDTFLATGQFPPRCPKCEGLIKPNTVLFGESLPFNVYQSARDEVTKADLFIVIGSSLSVYPANSLPPLAVSTGCRLLIVNVEPTPMDNKADVVIHEKAGEIMPKIISELKNND